MIFGDKINMVLSLICLVSLILFLTFETNAIVEYGRALNIPLPNFKEYNQIVESGGQIHYLKFLRGLHEKSFFFKLFTCAICFSVWLSLFLSLIFFTPLSFPKVEIFGLGGFFIMKILSKYSS